MMAHPCFTIFAALAAAAAGFNAPASRAAFASARPAVAASRFAHVRMEDPSQKAFGTASSGGVFGNLGTTVSLACASAFGSTLPNGFGSGSKPAVAAGLYNITQVSRRNLLRGAAWAASMYCGSGTISPVSAYSITQVKPNEKETYAVAQKGSGSLRVLWVGAGDMKGVFQSFFQAGNEVVALDLKRPDATDLSAATTYATEHGYQLRFEQGDATNMNAFTDGSFDAVVCSMFLCQDFNPEVVVSEIRRVLKPGGRFGFYEHVEDIDKVIVGKVFGERSVIRVEAYPERTNVVAGVVRKV